MLSYLWRRILLMVPTLLGVTFISFIIINMAPGGPVEQKLLKMRLSQSQQISGEVITALKVQYGFDKPVLTRYGIWLKNVVTFDFGDSFKYQRPVSEVIAEKLPVSLQFGAAALILTYLISVPLGVKKAVKEGSKFDLWTSIILLVAYSIPPLSLGILLREFLSSGQFLDIFPLSDLYSDNYATLSTFGQIRDRFMHFVLPLTCYVMNGFTVFAFLMKNSMLDEIKHDYVRTARAKGLDENAVVYKHTFRNALIPVVTSFASYLTAFFAGSIVIEQMFNLDGLGLLSYQSILARDYNVIMALILITSLVSIVGRLIADITYVLIDPRIDFK